MHTITFNRPAATFWDSILMLFAPKRFHQRVELPSKWSELTDRQIMDIVPLIYSGTASLPVQRLQVLKKLLKWPDETWAMLHPEQVWDLTRQIGWIWESSIGTSKLRFFTWKGKSFYLPSPGLKDMSGLEFAAAEQHLKEFTRDGGTAHSLNRLLATICRPLKSETGLEREPYSSDHAEHMAIEFRSVNLGMRMAILQWYVAQIKDLQANYPKVFPKSEPAPGATSGGGPLAEFGMLAILFSLADQGTFGDFEKTCTTNLHTILLYLTKKALEHEELERQQRQQMASR